MQKFIAATNAYWTRNTSFQFVVMGLCIGATLGVVCSFKRRGIAAIAGGTGGAIGGLVSGYAVGLSIAQSALTSADQSLVLSAGAHFAVWAGVLSLSVLAIGISQEGFRRAAIFLIAGLVSAMGISALYILSGSIMFMNSNLLMVFPATLTERLVWVAICTLSGGLILHLSLREQSPKNS
jgi:hypothetical protein